MDRLTELLDSLTGDARDFARAVLETHPEWLPAARVEVTGELASLVVELPAPRPGSPPLLIWTDADEITVSYDRWHAHFDAWAETPDEAAAAFGDARAVVESLLAEDLAIAVTMRGDAWLGSRTLSAGAVPDPPPAGAHTYVRSWAGTRDADYRAA